MTRKHFNALANALKAAHPTVTGLVQPWNYKSPTNKAWWQAVQGVADACSQFNPSFDRDRFVSACTPNQTVEGVDFQRR